MLLGSLALTAGCVALTFSPGLLLTHHTSAGLVALVHVFTLGFVGLVFAGTLQQLPAVMFVTRLAWPGLGYLRSEEHTSELQSRGHLVCRLLLEQKKPDDPDQSGADAAD